VAGAAELLSVPMRFMGAKLGLQRNITPFLHFEIVAIIRPIDIGESNWVFLTVEGRGAG